MEKNSIYMLCVFVTKMQQNTQCTLFDLFRASNINWRESNLSQNYHYGVLVLLLRFEAHGMPSEWVLGLGFTPFGRRMQKIKWQKGLPSQKKFFAYGFKAILSASFLEIFYFEF